LTGLTRCAGILVVALLGAISVGQGSPLLAEQEEQVASEEEPAAQGEGRPVVLLLPGTEEVEGWSTVQDSLTYCSTPESLTEIYDGGYEDYVTAGVQEAAVQAYQSDDDLLLVYIHQMASPEQAEAIGQGFHDSLTDGSGTLISLELGQSASAEATADQPSGSGTLAPLEVEQGGFLCAGGGQTTAYLWRDCFYCAVVASGDAETHQRSVGQFVDLLDEKIAAYLGEEETKPSKEQAPPLE